MTSESETPVRQWDGDPRLAGAQVETYKTVDGVELLMYIFDPPGGPPGGGRPGIVFFHGGGWAGGEPAQFGEQCKYLASRGMVAMSAEYRVRERQGAMPWQGIADARSAIRWARANAGRLGLDPHRLAAGGSSAGGHLAAAAALIETFDEPGEDRSISAAPDALVLFNPALDTTPEKWKERFGEKARDCSPAHHAGAGVPPTIVFHGKDDGIIPCAQATAFAEIVEKAGSRCEVMLYDGAGHGFFNYARRDEGFYEPTLRAADRFLASLGWLSGEPEI